MSTYLNLTFQHLLVLTVTLGGDQGTDFIPCLGRSTLYSPERSPWRRNCSVPRLPDRAPALTTPFNYQWLRSFWGHSPGWQWHIQQSAEQHWTVSEQTGKSASALGCVCHNLVALRISGEENTFRWQATQKETSKRETMKQYCETRGGGNYRKRVKVFIKNI